MTDPRIRLFAALFLSVMALMFSIAPTLAWPRDADWKSRELCERLCFANASNYGKYRVCVRNCMRSWQR